MITTAIKQKLERSLPGAIVEVMDESASHAGHGATGAHLAVSVIYAGFARRSKLEQHQWIYSLLEREMKGQIHALKITAKVNKDD